MSSMLKYLSFAAAIACGAGLAAAGSYVPAGYGSSPYGNSQVGNSQFCPNGQCSPCSNGWCGTSPGVGTSGYGVQPRVGSVYPASYGNSTYTNYGNSSLPYNYGTPSRGYNTYYGPVSNPSSVWPSTSNGYCPNGQCGTIPSSTSTYRYGTWPGVFTGVDWNANPYSTNSFPREMWGLAGLSSADQQVALRQRTCPISGELLGSRGTPVKVTYGGQTFFVCCQECAARYGSSNGNGYYFNSGFNPGVQPVNYGTSGYQLR
jgi:YHS domain-containing protein